MDQQPLVATSAEPSENDRTLLLIAYILYALAPFNGVTAVAGVILNHLKLGDSTHPFLHSHHRWLLRTFWFSLLWFAILALLHVTIVLIPLAWFGGAVVCVWYIYRVVRGALNFSERKPMPV